MEIGDLAIRFVLKDDLLSLRKVLCDRFLIQEYPKGHCFNRAGTKSDYLYFILDGQVDVYTLNEQGYVRLIGIHQRNTLFNLDNLVNEPAIITTIANTKVTGICVTMNDLLTVLKEHPEHYALLLSYLSKVLRLMCYDAIEQSIRDVKTRLLHFLLLYAHNNESMKIPFSQQRIASAINASRIQVARILAELKASGVIELHRNSVVICSLDGLLEALEERNECA